MSLLCIVLVSCICLSPFCQVVFFFSPSLHTIETILAIIFALFSFCLTFFTICADAQRPLRVMRLRKWQTVMVGVLCSSNKSYFLCSFSFSANQFCFFFSSSQTINPQQLFLNLTSSQESIKYSIHNTCFDICGRNECISIFFSVFIRMWVSIKSHSNYIYMGVCVYICMCGYIVTLW